MLKFINLIVFEVVEVCVLRGASPNRDRGFNKVITQVAIAGANELSVLSFKLTGLLLSPSEPRIFSKSGLIVEVIDITDFSNDSCCLYRVYARYRQQSVGNKLKLFADSLIKRFDLTFQSFERGNLNRKNLVDGVVYSLGQTIRTSCGSL